MSQFTIPIIVTTELVYVVEARSATEAGIVLGANLAENPDLGPTHQRVLTRRILSAKRLVTDPTLDLDV